MKAPSAHKLTVAADSPVAAAAGEGPPRLSPILTTRDEGECPACGLPESKTARCREPHCIHKPTWSDARPIISPTGVGDALKQAYPAKGSEICILCQCPMWSAPYCRWPDCPGKERA